jgi:hypothetical protein
MARTNVTEERVNAICDRIYIETGRDPTYPELTGELNCSNSTVKPFYDSWKARPRPGRQPIPQKLASTLESFAQAMWGHALGAAVEVVLPKKEEMQADFVRCQAQLASAMQIVEEGEQERSLLQAEIRGLMQQVAELQVRLGMAALAPARCIDLEKMVESMRAERDAANARASDALGQVSAHERQIRLLLSSMREKPARRRTRKRPTIQGGDARG